MCHAIPHFHAVIDSVGPLKRALTSWTSVDSDAAARAKLPEADAVEAGVISAVHDSLEGSIEGVRHSVVAAALAKLNYEERISHVSTASTSLPPSLAPS